MATTTTAITIHTQLHDGIYASSGGGQNITHYSWAIGPRNLLQAIDVLAEHGTSMTSGYGNIGRGATWLEIDGQRMDANDFVDIQMARDPAERRAHLRDYSCLPWVSATQLARELIASVRDGSYARGRRELAAYLDAERQSEYDDATAQADAEVAS